ncbi:GNAT family N-acetyltransferase [Amycolatopsis pittospori]|uniref:GNAT family N-acetyltransferase n=1 Tax=Amycolatopsis pittospori TaxID=2749434 RepID=UPI0015F0535D|nr:GNAT family N-acetyltransferase [Amycolatopsis pittospori]
MTFPVVRIDTGKLVIREFDTADATAATMVIAAGDWAALPPGAPRSPLGVSHWLRERLPRFRNAGMGVHLAVLDGESGAHLGAMSLFNPDWDRRSVEIGYGLRSSFRGQGVMSEALPALTAWALSTGRMRRVELRTEPRNAASIRVAEKSGFVQEATVLDMESGTAMLLFSQEHARRHIHAALRAF